MKNNKQTIMFSVAASVSTVLSAFGFVVFSLKEASPSKTLIFICSCLLGLLASLYITILLLSINKEPNFYLYDAASKRNVAIEQLNFGFVSKKTRKYIDDFLGGYKELLFDRTLLDDARFGVAAVLRPAVVYQMLYDVADNALDADMLLSAGDKNQRAICACLTFAGETDLVNVLKKQFAESNGTGLARFLMGNKRYLAGRQLAYVRRSIDKFY